MKKTFMGTTKRAIQDALEPHEHVIGAAVLDELVDCLLLIAEGHHTKHKYQIGLRVDYTMTAKAQIGRDEEAFVKVVPCVVVGIRYADDESGGYEYAIAKSKPSGWGGGDIIEWIDESKIVPHKEN